MALNRELLIHILEEHQYENCPESEGDCSCGYWKFGRHWGEHIADLYEAQERPSKTHKRGEECDICDGRGVDYLGRTCRRLET